MIDKIPGIETADYEIAEVEHTVPALTKLLKGSKVLRNMVGPFAKYGPEAVEACACRRRALHRHQRRTELDDRVR